MTYCTDFSKLNYMGIIKDLLDQLTKLLTWWVIIMPWQQGIRVTLGKTMRLLEGGIYLKLPLVHSVYVQEKRLRVVNLPIQTVCTRDGHALTISCSVGYTITDIMKLYTTLYLPDMTIQNIVASQVAKQISNTLLADCTPILLESTVSEALSVDDYGLEFSGVKVLNFAYVKTLRLIQDQSYLYEGLNLLTKA